eukprot:7371867-Pyramimonas_sp.AAC.1
MHREGTSIPNRPVIADWGLIAPTRRGTCGLAIGGLSPISRRCIADSRSMFPSLCQSALSMLLNSEEKKGEQE